MMWLNSLSALSGENSTKKATGKNHKTTAKILLVTTGILLAGCASKPVINPGQSRLIVIPQYYTVKPGDTLSEIAARYNLDYHDIAALNNIDSSYTIYVNQSLRLHDNSKNAPRIQVRTSATPAPVTIQTQALPSPVVQKPVSAVRPAPVITPGQLSPNRTLADTPVTLPTGVNWQWPANGNIIENFDLSRNIKGMRIGGQQGDPVRAAADGEVVYASDRLTEYGNLVLIRHASGYVTAYAHNSKMLVKETDRVKAGQKIAEMGSSGASQVMLEFQIRLNGKPINPASLLPAR